MQRPRYAPPNYNQHQPRWTPGMPRFGLPLPMIHRNHSTNYYSKEPSNFKSTNEEYWCETCDRGFRNIQLLENHKQQHQKCNIDGCQFIAHPKVITKHIQMQHSTGLYKKISKLDNPEEIKKWREERKKRYPTKENIQQKSAEIKEKIDRGEKMAMKYNRECKSYRTEQGTKRKYNEENNYRNKFKRKFGAKQSIEARKNKTTFEVNTKSLPPRINKPIPSEDDSSTLKPFAGILHLLDDINSDTMEEPQNSDSIEDDEYTLDECNEINKSTPTDPLVCGALSSLICNYECSDDEPVTELEVKHKIPTDNNIQNHTANHQDKILKSNECINNIIVSKSDDDSGPEEAKVVKATDIVSKMDMSNNINKECTNIENRKWTEKIIKHDSIHNRKNLKKFKAKLPSTLLEKLLHNEIRQERNIILQCIRYVVKNKYFEKNVETAEKEF